MARLFIICLALLNSLTSSAWAKDQKQWFNQGFSEYMASRCATAMEPLYQASLLDGPLANTSHLYLAHCQSLLGQSDSAAYHLGLVDGKSLEKADKKLFRELKKKHQDDIDRLEAIGYSLTPYVGQSQVSPDSTKSGSSYYGAALSLYRPRWSLGLGYESLALKLTAKNSTAYTQSMIFAQAGFFVIDSLKISASATSVNANAEQMKSISVFGVQTDYYVTPAFSLYAEFYTSNYPKLLADSKYTYKYPVSANQVVVGSSFPIYNDKTYGFNGGASFTSISLSKSSDAAAVSVKSLESNTQRVELVVSSWFHAATAAVTYWTGTEVLGVRARGAIINNSTELKKGGQKLSLGYGFTKHVGIGLSASSEDFEATDATTGTYTKYSSTGEMATLSLNW